MRAKKEEQLRARWLRLQGWSLRAIANELGVSISSVSSWAREIPQIRGPRSRDEAPSPIVHSGATKRCARCERLQPIEHFSRHPRYGHQHWCKRCFLAYFRKRGDLHRAQSAAAKRRRRINARRFADDYLGRTACIDCGEADPIVLEFDHTGEKHGTVSKLIAAGWSLKRLEREIELCEVVCVNCHRRRTAARDPSWRTDPWALDANRRLLPGELRNMQLVRDTLIAARCVDCGLGDVLILEFDHVGPKRSNVVAMARRGCSLMTLEHEIAQCEIRCGNCHRRRTRRLDHVRARAA